MPRKSQKERKPYPTHEERLSAVDADIERLTKLNQERIALVQKTEEKLAERKEALKRCEDMLLKAQAKREKIISVMNRPKKETVKLTPEERAAKRRESLAKAREVKKEEKEKMNALLAVLEEKGMTLEEAMEQLKA